MDAVSKVVPYSMMVIRNLFADTKGTSETFAKLVEKFNEEYKEQFGSGPYNDFQQRLLLHGVRALVKTGAITVVKDDFAPEFLIWSIKGLPQLAQIEPAVQNISDKIKAIGGYNSSKFLLEALRGFEYKHRDEAIKYLDEFNKTFGSPPPAEAEQQAVEDPKDVDDSWEPLRLERDTPEAKDAISKSELALQEIEHSNGYSSAEHDERNGIVSSIKATLEAIRLGSPSRQLVIAGLLTPLRFIARKFSEASMGEAAKIAVAAIVKWLF